MAMILNRQSLSMNKIFSLILRFKLKGFLDWKPTHQFNIQSFQFSDKKKEWVWVSVQTKIPNFNERVESS